MNIILIPEIKMSLYSGGLDLVYFIGSFLFFKVDKIRDDDKHIRRMGSKPSDHLRFGSVIKSSFKYL